MGLYINYVRVDTCFTDCPGAGELDASTPGRRLSVSPALPRRKEKAGRPAPSAASGQAPREGNGAPGQGGTRRRPCLPPGTPRGLCSRVLHLRGRERGARQSRDRAQVSYPSANPGHFAELPVEKVKKDLTWFCIPTENQPLGISYINMKNNIYTFFVTCWNMLFIIM